MCPRDTCCSTTDSCIIRWNMPTAVAMDKTRNEQSMMLRHAKGLARQNNLQLSPAAGFAAAGSQDHLPTSLWPQMARCGLPCQRSQGQRHTDRFSLLHNKNIRRLSRLESRLGALRDCTSPASANVSGTDISTAACAPRTQRSDTRLPTRCPYPNSWNNL